jgi:hypothetical protein
LTFSIGRERPALTKASSSICDRIAFAPEAYQSEAERQVEYEREREKQLKERALTFLIHTKRAENVESAERYLERINEIKEKLVQFTREQILDKEGWQGVNDPEYPHIVFGYDRADAADLDRIMVRNINRTNPELWKLKRSVQNSYHNLLPDSDPGSGGFGVLDRLTVNLDVPRLRYILNLLAKVKHFLRHSGNTSLKRI